MERLSIDEVMAHCRRTCEHTETMAIAQGKTQDDIISNDYWEHYQVEEWLKELKAYRDAEEQGLLLMLPAPLDGVEQFSLDGETIWHRLPCMTGTKVYEITGITWKGYDWKYRCYDNAYVRESTFQLNDYSSFGDTKFLTREEAERALEKAKEEVEQALKQMGE